MIRLLSRDDIERAFQLIFNLQRAAGDGYKLDAERSLAQCEFAVGT
jgi:hypothetical protein